MSDGQRRDLSVSFFLKTKLLCQNFFGETERIRVSAVLQKKGEADKCRGKTGEKEPPIRKRKGGARAGEKIGARRAEKMRKTRENRQEKERRRKKKEELGAAEQKSGSGRIICKQFDAK